ncbi:MAG: DUF3850 domain-containing protein [Lachnospiraceae bacterium]|nr:DUF3850 domain-containing protein [Lachnospiraceae bacterium]
MIHQLKCKAEYFEQIADGRKTFEVRKNDRNFHVGDYLALNELKPHNKNAERLETGRSVLVRVHMMIDNPEYVKEGYVILGIEGCVVDVLGVGCMPMVLTEERKR